MPPPDPRPDVSARWLRAAGLALVAGLGLTQPACEADGPQMMPGSDCTACHTHAPGEHHAFGVAGTVFTSASGASGLAGATIEITDADGGQVSLVSNVAGNFFTGQALALPLRAVAITRAGRRVEMPAANPITSGSCNACHSAGGAAHGVLVGP